MQWRRRHEGEEKARERLKSSGGGARESQLFNAQRYPCNVWPAGGAGSLPAGSLPAFPLVKRRKRRPSTKLPLTLHT